MTENKLKKKFKSTGRSMRRDQ